MTQVAGSFLQSVVSKLSPNQVCILLVLAILMFGDTMWGR